MEQKIQLTHPQKKKAPSIDKEKYDAIRSSLVGCLKRNGKSTHAEIMHEVGNDFKTQNVKFQGSLQWYVEWVKLNLEAKHIVKRIPRTSPQQYALMK